jgi:hypothetical protein
MLPEFRSQLFQLPLIATTWTFARNRYIQEKTSSSFPVRFTLSIIEQTISLVHGNVIQPLLNPCHTYCKLFYQQYNRKTFSREISFSFKVSKTSN